jgi:nitroreductase
MRAFATHTPRRQKPRTTIEKSILTCEPTLNGDPRELKDDGKEDVCMHVRTYMYVYVHRLVDRIGIYTCVWGIYIAHIRTYVCTLCTYVHTYIHSFPLIGHVML